MSEPTQNGNSFEVYKLLIGAFLSIIGGFFAVVFRARVERKAEIEYIKIGLKDELAEICSILSKMIETYKTTHIVSNVYLNDLSKNTESFDYHKQRLFLIKDDSLRSSVRIFYKNLGETISDSINKVGKLGEVQVGNEHDQIINKFNSTYSECSTLKAKIEKYKYKAFWVV